MIRTLAAAAVIAAAALPATTTDAPAPAPAPAVVTVDCTTVPSGVAITPGRDWTPDSRPACTDGTVTVPIDQTTTVTH